MSNPTHILSMRAVVANSAAAMAVIGILADVTHREDYLGSHDLMSYLGLPDANRIERGTMNLTIGKEGIVLTPDADPASTRMTMSVVLALTVDRLGLALDMVSNHDKLSTHLAGPGKVVICDLADVPGMPGAVTEYSIGPTDLDRVDVEILALLENARDRLGAKVDLTPLKRALGTIRAGIIGTPGDGVQTSQGSSSDPAAAQAGGFQIDEREVMDILTVEMPAYLEYDEPAKTPEWTWLEHNASFAHRANNEVGGTYEFIVNCALGFEAGPPPGVVGQAIEAARARGIGYVCFCQ